MSLVNKILKLSQELRKKGFNNQAEEIENNLMLLKSSKNKLDSILYKNSNNKFANLVNYIKTAAPLPPAATPFAAPTAPAPTAPAPAAPVAPAAPGAPLNVSALADELDSTIGERFSPSGLGRWTRETLLGIAPDDTGTALKQLTGGLLSGDQRTTQYVRAVLEVKAKGGDAGCARILEILKENPNANKSRLLGLLDAEVTGASTFLRRLRSKARGETGWGVKWILRTIIGVATICEAISVLWNSSKGDIEEIEATTKEYGETSDISKIMTPAIVIYKDVKQKLSAFTAQRGSNYEGVSPREIIETMKYVEKEFKKADEKLGSFLSHTAFTDTKELHYSIKEFLKNFSTEMLQIEGALTAYKIKIRNALKEKNIPVKEDVINWTDRELIDYEEEYKALVPGRVPPSAATPGLLEKVKDAYDARVKSRKPMQIQRTTLKGGGTIALDLTKMYNNGGDPINMDGSKIQDISKFIEILKGN